MRGAQVVASHMDITIEIQVDREKHYGIFIAFQNARLSQRHSMVPLLIVSNDPSAKGKALNMNAYSGASIRIGIFSCIPRTRCRCNWASEGHGAHGVHARETRLMLTREYENLA